MGVSRAEDSNEHEGGVVIPFPRSGSTPPPLPRLPRAIPTPGGGSHSSSLFGAALTRRFDRDAA